jgi:hypothetical protein
VPRFAQKRIILEVLVSAIAVVAVGCSPVFADAPQQLYNKTIVMNWNEYRVQRADAGDISKTNTSSSLLVYVSSSGRLFTRLSRNNSRRSNSNDLDPEGGNQRMGAGAAGNLKTSFEGQQLLIENSMKSGARRIQATFNSGFSGCSLTVRFGKEGGADIRHRGMDGRMYNIISTDVSAQSCSTKVGNVFAVQ